MLTTSLLVSLLLMSAPAASDRYGAFAFPNAAGTELLIRHQLPDPERLHTAVCGARKVAVRFVRRQTVGQEHARDTPDEFSRLEGTVFHVLNARLDPKSTCFIAEDALLAGAVLLPITGSAKPTTCTPDDQRRAAALRTRAIKSCWKLAALPAQGLIAAIEYERAGRDALASVIVLGGRNRNVLIDFPAEFTADGDDLWRVEDGGHLLPERFAIPFVLRQANAVMVPLAWGGVEGVALHVYAAEGSAPARDVISDYWYRAPR